MPLNSELIALANQVLLSNYRQAPLVLSHGEGCYVWCVENNRYLDFYAGIAVSTLGHNHPKIVDAIRQQASQILHTTNLVYNEPSIRLAERLTALTAFEPGGEKVLTRAFFCNSGTEAIEACIKLARRAAFLKNEPKRKRFLAFNNAFHGRTMGALALTGTPKYWEGFGCDLESVTHVSYGDLLSVKQALDAHRGEYAAIVVEPIQGEGGVTPAPTGFLKALQELANEANALFIVDEVQTGIGRTGTWFAFQREGVIPDAIALAKGLAGGVPIGAMLVREHLNSVLTPGSHGSTFGGNPFAAAVALAVLKAIEEELLLENVRTRGEQLNQGLALLTEKHSTIFEQNRGVGLLQGLVLKPPFEARTLLNAVREQGVLFSLASERVLRCTPPLVIKHEHVDEALAAIDRAVEPMIASTKTAS